ncbi:MAG: exodeoxyribonuclease VII small subunit [Anaerolineales bacterium]|nr:exodeoxyribonuclease VII small subunit [Anaerolineales bacterium]MCX7756522.1 exodeoxyribonuclease VII small subunit [Anaerolineales bacterium]MDW8279487.1 exodeoxyribonuclease VII small subunit [Anaerolineales bacterium]
MTTSKPIEEMTYEEAFAALQAVVTALESESHSLEEALALYERGQALVRHSAALLQQAELRVRQLNGTVFAEES